jgi:hypothetical protein
MPRWPILVPAGIAAALLVLPATSGAQAADARSLARIRAALEKAPPPLQMAPRSGEIPTFRVEVEQYIDLQRSVDDPPLDPTMGIPSAGELLMGGIGKIHSAVVGYKRGRAKRKARKEVQDALTEFCAVHECPAPPARP